MATDLTWRIRRAAARWLFVERRMELVGEEVGIHTGEHEITSQWAEGSYKAPDGLRSVDVLGLTRAVPNRKRQEIRAIEVKVSRADLLAGIRKGQVGNDPAKGGIGAVVDFAHLLVWHEVRIDFGEIPDRWGVLAAREVQPGWSGEGEKPRPIIRIDITRPAKRLTPAFPLDVDQLGRAITQASLWRLYGPGHELTVRRYSVAYDVETGRYRDREVAVG